VFLLFLGLCLFQVFIFSILILSIFIFSYFYVFIYLFSILTNRAGPPVFPKDFFNRNGTSPGPPQWLPWPPCPAPAPALFVTTDKQIDRHRERAVTGRIFQALPT
jgi:hypothetical protein